MNEEEKMAIIDLFFTDKISAEEAAKALDISIEYFLPFTPNFVPKIEDLEEQRPLTPKEIEKAMEKMGYIEDTKNKDEFIGFRVYKRKGTKKMEKIEKGIVEVENAKNLDQLKKGILAVFKESDQQVDYLRREVDELRSREIK